MQSYRLFYLDNSYTSNDIFGTRSQFCRNLQDIRADTLQQPVAILADMLRTDHDLDRCTSHS